MFAPKTEADDPPGDPAEHRAAVEQTDRPGRTVKTRARLQDDVDDIVMCELLSSLENPCRQHPPRFDPGKQAIDIAAIE